MWMYFLWYLLTGIVLILAVAIGDYIGILRRFGLDIACEAIDYIHENRTATPNFWYEWVTFTVIGLLVWPLRLSEFPSTANEYWEKCVELQHRIGETGSGS